MAFSIIDGMILTDMWREKLGKEKFDEIEKNVDERLHPESTAKVCLAISLRVKDYYMACLFFSGLSVSFSTRSIFMDLEAGQ